MLPVDEIIALHQDRVAHWHQHEVDNPYEGSLQLVCTQFGFNFRLWHEEDIARSHDVSDDQLAQVKRNIDKLNQQRNDWIEKIDDWVADELERNNVSADDAPMNTETIGSVVDRLSILALRIYHMEEQAERADATDEHRENSQQKLAICLAQLDDLSTALTQVVDDVATGKKRHRTYRALKMYNDPTMNPYLYQAQKRLAG